MRIHHIAGLSALLIAGCGIFIDEDKSCTSNALCDDRNPCTEDICELESGICLHFLQLSTVEEGPEGDSTCSNGRDDDCDGRTDAEDIDCGYVLTWVRVEAGTFDMGSPADELGRNADEVGHEVTLTRDFEIWPTETTREDFLSVMGYDPSMFTGCGADCPAERTTWFDAVAYTNELSKDSGKQPCYLLSNVTCSDSSTVADYMDCFDATAGGIDSATVELNGVSSVYDCQGYRLPTEAEWEYAARAGTSTATYNGSITDEALLACTRDNPVLDSIAWICLEDNPGTFPVAALIPNPWGLYDMFGNVHEWCNDWYDAYSTGAVTDPEGPATGTEKVFRGGGWFSPSEARAAYRPKASSDWRGYIGFRPVRSLP